jgi:hypothetical protein
MEVAKMSLRMLGLVYLLAFLAAAAPLSAASNAESTLIVPQTPQAAQIISRLEQARHLDRMNAQSYTGGVDSEARRFYYGKAQEVDALLNRLHEGHAVSARDVQRALDNSGAARFAGSS